MDFFGSLIGQLVLQTYLHSVIIAIAVEAIISLWHIQPPSLQVRFRLLVLSPALYLPFFFLLYPPRSSSHFHQAVAIFDLSQWLRMRLAGELALWHLLAALLALTTLFFLLREAWPTARHYLGRRPLLPKVREGQFPGLDAALKELARRGSPRPLVRLSPEEVPVIYTTGRCQLVLSAAVLNGLDTEELRAVIAHELAHFTWEIYATGWLCLALRFLAFYNPVALLAFRRIINDNEKHCDDLAIAATGRPLALASGLLKVFRHAAAVATPAGAAEHQPSRLPQVSALQDSACRELLKERVQRVLHPEAAGALPHPTPRLIATFGLLALLLFFVV